MRRNHMLGVALAGSVWLLTDVAESQIVRRYPGGAVHVRAPFVRVFVGPLGETSVRAPFVAVDTPGRRYVTHHGARVKDPHRKPPGQLQPQPQAQPQPTPADPAALDWQALRRMLRSGATRLEEQLDRTAPSKGWKEHLQTELLRELVAEDVDRPPDAETIEALRAVLRRYDTTAASEQFHAIASMSGFQMVRSALGELVVRPLHRARRQLADSAGDLQRALVRLDTGSQWIHYLQLPHAVFIGASSAAPPAPLPPGAEPTSEEGLRQLVDALTRFDSVIQNPAHREISELPSFKKTHQRLTTYVALLRGTLAEHPSDDRQLEVLPTPLPEPL